MSLLNDVFAAYAAPPGPRDGRELPGVGYRLLDAVSRMPDAMAVQRGGTYSLTGSRGGCTLAPKREGLGKGNDANGRPNGRKFRLGCEPQEARQSERERVMLGLRRKGARQTVEAPPG